MRTFSAAAQAVMDNGSLEPYIAIGLADTDPNNFAEWVQPVYFKLTDTEAEVMIPIETDGTLHDPTGGYFALRRGVYINGTPETTTTTSFYTIEILKDEKFYHLKGQLLPNDYKNL